MPRKFSIHIPPIVRPRSSQDTHSFQRLRSFYLSPSPTKAQFDIASLSSPPGASTSPSPISAHFPAGISPQTSTAAGDNCSERTLRAVCSMDSVERAKFPGDAKRVSAREAGNGDGGPRKSWMGIRRPRRNRCRGTFLMLCVVMLSLFLVMSLSLAFVGGNAGDAYFKKSLDLVAKTDSGIVLVGESVDADIDEPSVDIRWSILACGGGFVLPGSEGLLGGTECGLPIEPLQIFVDSETTPVATYNPTRIPYQRSTGHRRNIESLVRFTTTHVLDVHKARLYPFDSYKLTSSLRAARVPTTNASNGSGPQVEDALRISRILTQGMTSNFDIETNDMESFLQAAASPGSVSGPTSLTSTLSVTSQSTSSSSTSASTATTPTSTSVSTPTSPPERRAEGGLSSVLSPQTPFPSRDFDMQITRPPAAQMFVLLMFALSWVLVHVSVVMAFLARRSTGASAALYKDNGDDFCRRVTVERDSKLIGYTFLSVAVLGAVFGMRRSMPDAPEFDGILLDCIGFFPQVIITGLCILTLLFTIGARDIDTAGVLPCDGPSDSEPYPYPAHCHCPRGLEESPCNGPRATWPHPREHPATDSEASDSSTTTSPDHVQYARRYQSPTHSPNCRQSLISAFPPPPGFRRSQSLSSPFSPATSSPSSPPVSPRSPASFPVSPRGVGVSRPGNSNVHVCTSNGSSSSAGAELGHWHFPSASTHSLPVSPTRMPSDLERSRVMSPSPKLPRSPLAPLSPTSPISFASHASPTSPLSPASPTASVNGRKKFAFALGSVFGGSPSPPGSPNSKLGFSISGPGLKRSAPRKGSSASLGGRKGSRNGDVELELRRSVKRRESGVAHRRVRTASVVREGSGEDGGKEGEREVSRWSDHEDD